LLLSAGAPAARPQLSIDIFCPQSDQQQTRRPSLLLSIDGTDRQTDGRTPDRIDVYIRILCGGATAQRRALYSGTPIQTIFPNSFQNAGHTIVGKE